MWSLEHFCSDVGVPKGPRRLAPGFNLGNADRSPSMESRRDDGGGSTNVFRFKYVFRVVFDVMTFQDGQEFIFETQGLMMFRLSLDVSSHDWYL